MRRTAALLNLFFPHSFILIPSGTVQINSATVNASVLLMRFYFACNYPRLTMLSPSNRYHPNNRTQRNKSTTSLDKRIFSTVERSEL